MAKVFTIIPGLENMGAMKTGGQGSVYKGRRVGEIITAIKLLPTPIYNENEDSKSYRDFRNEVAKLKKVNEEPNPNVVKILSSGLTETGNFPFIEMEFIEGPDLEELLKPPYDPVFTIKEVIKVAEHISNALAHCHRKDIKHGDIKSNNVKFNIHTGNYVLLDFGLAAMSDEQRRTSLRQAGAIEFMAPEQNEGTMLFESDIYSFGVILFELLAGKVPFPLHDKGETARNFIRLSHMETPPPDLIELRSEALPGNWSQEKRDREMKVPDWLINVVYKCLEKRPQNRFHNGWELYQEISDSITLSAAETNRKVPAGSLDSTYLSKEQLQQHVAEYRQQLAAREQELNTLRASINNNLTSESQSKSNSLVEQKGVSTTSFVALLILTLAFGSFSAFSYYKYFRNGAAGVAETAERTSTVPNNTASLPEERDEPTPEQKKEEPVVTKPKPIDIPATKDTTARKRTPPPPTVDNEVDDAVTSPPVNNTTTEKSEEPQKPTGNKYVVVNKAYFFNAPDETTRRSAYMVPSDKATLTATDDINGFVYVTFTNQFGQTSKGWLKKSDLKVSE